MSNAQQQSQTIAQQIAEHMEKNGEALLEHAPNHWTKATVRRQAMAVARNGDWKVQQCTAKSLCNAIAKAAHLGLDIDAGDTHVVAYKKSDNAGNEWYEAELMHSYKGLIKLAERSINILSVMADVVREGDEVEFYRDVQEGLHFRHKPPPFDSSGDIIGAYCLVERREGEDKLERLSRQDLKKIRSKADEGSFAWKDFPAEMCKKAAIKRALKKVDKSPELRGEIQRENEQFYTVGRQQDRQLEPASNDQTSADRQVEATTADPNERFAAPSSDPEPVGGQSPEDRRLEAEVVNGNGGGQADGGRPDPPMFNFATSEDINLDGEHDNQGHVRKIYALLDHLDDGQQEAFWNAAKAEWGVESRKQVPPQEMARFANFLDELTEEGRLRYAQTLAA
ncbi:MAG: recombinase RecT [Bradymonadaceae bacterium]